MLCDMPILHRLQTDCASHDHQATMCAKAVHVYRAILRRSAKYESWVPMVTVAEAEFLWNCAADLAYAVDRDEGATIPFEAVYQVCSWPAWCSMQDMQVVCETVSLLAERTLRAAYRLSQEKFVDKLKSDLASSASFGHRLAKGPQPQAPTGEQALHTLEEQTAKWSEVWTQGDLGGCQAMLQAVQTGAPPRLLDAHRAGGVLGA